MEAPGQGVRSLRRMQRGFRIRETLVTPARLPRCDRNDECVNPAGYQLTRPGFWARQPSSEGNTVSISTRPRSPSNMCSTAERQAT